jgi:hypothetical protein
MIWLCALALVSFSLQRSSAWTSIPSLKPSRRPVVRKLQAAVNGEAAETDELHQLRFSGVARLYGVAGANQLKVMVSLVVRPYIQL